MKKKVTLVFFLFWGIPGMAVGLSFSGGLGGEFFNYSTNYLTMGLGFQNDMGQGVEADLGSDFGITTAKDPNGSGNTVARFHVPVNIGANFLFPSNVVTLGLGVGVLPVFDFSSTSAYSSAFYFGPYLKGILRLKVHPVMSLYLNVEQDLLIGGPNWINTETKATTGILFSLGAPQPPKVLIPNQVQP